MEIKILGTGCAKCKDPSHATGTEEFIWSEFRRVRDEIKEAFYKLYVEQINKQKL